MSGIQLNKQNLSEQVYDHIKRLILSGELKGGEKVPEEKLSKLFGISRTPLREALKRLSDYGLIYLKPRSYAEVTIIDGDEAKQIAQVRLHMEILATKLFIANAEENDFKALQKIIDDCLNLTQNGDIAGSFEADSRLHLEIAKRCGNRVLYDMMEKLDARIQLCRLNQHLSIEKLIEYTRQHKVLLTSLKDKNMKEVEKMLRNHILHDFHEE